MQHHFERDADALTWAAETIVSYLVEAVVHWLEFGAPDRDDEMVELTTAGLHALVAAWRS